MEKAEIIKLLKIISPLLALQIYFLIIRSIKIGNNKENITQKVKKKSSLRTNFIIGTIKTLFVISMILLFLSNFSFFVYFKNSFLMSSSLIIVVLGFVFQEGLSNIIHGCIIFIFKPFEINDRIQITIDGEIISGYVKNINLRHTSIITIIDNSICIIPNSKLDNSVIKNLSNKKISNKYPLTIPISYNDASDKYKRDLAKKIFKKAIFNNKYTLNEKGENNRDNEDSKNIDKNIDSIFIKIDYDNSSVNMTSFIITNTIEENIIACSEIKEIILDEFAKNNITIPFNTVTNIIEIDNSSNNNNNNHSNSYKDQNFKIK